METITEIRCRHCGKLLARGRAEDAYIEFKCPRCGAYTILRATAKRLGNKRGAYLRANLDRARKIMLRQYRYIRFLKTDWIKRLRMPILPYPKRQPD